MTAPYVDASDSVSFAVEGGAQVSALLHLPPTARACYVLAHGAGAGMHHPFMSAVAGELGALGIATLRYQFPYMERRSPGRIHPRCVTPRCGPRWPRPARLAPALPLLAGGRSFGGRMTSQAQALAPLPGRARTGLSRLPLHPAGTPGRQPRRSSLRVQLPMLFLQGTRDALAEARSLRRSGHGWVCARASCGADADHSFRVPARSGRTDAQVRSELLQTLSGWMDTLLRASAPSTATRPSAPSRARQSPCKVPASAQVHCCSSCRNMRHGSCTTTFDWSSTAC